VRELALAVVVERTLRLDLLSGIERGEGGGG
jgi:hypothetical protein